MKILITLVAVAVGGILQSALACTGCGCTAPAPKKNSAECASGVCALPVAAQTHSHDGGGHLSTVQMVQAVQAGKAVILDARSAKYDTGERIPGAKSLTADATDTAIFALLPKKEAEIITYCSNTQCPASRKLYERLHKLGYSRVREYPEGIAGWKAAGGAVDKAQ